MNTINDDADDEDDVTQRDDTLNNTFDDTLNNTFDDTLNNTFVDSNDNTETNQTNINENIVDLKPLSSSSGYGYNNDDDDNGYTTSDTNTTVYNPFEYNVHKTNDQALSTIQEEEDNNINTFTKILKIELLLKIFCLINKNITFKMYEGRDESSSTAIIDVFDNNHDDDDEGNFFNPNDDNNDNNDGFYVIKNEQNIPLIDVNEIKECLNLLLEKSTLDKKLPLPPLLSTLPPFAPEKEKKDEINKEIVLALLNTNLSDPNIESYKSIWENTYEVLDENDKTLLLNITVDIITFNDIEAIIDMNSYDPEFDKKFKNIMNLIFLSKEPVISVNPEFYDLLNKVCNEIKDVLKNHIPDEKMETGGNTKHNILKKNKNTQKYIEKTNKKTKRRKNKKVSKKKSIKSKKSKTRKYRRKRLS
jgi:hypothetical protein